MKRLLILTVYLFIYAFNSYPQFYADSVTPDYIIELMKIADEFELSTKNFTDEEIKHIAELYFKCYDQAPLDLNSYVATQHDFWMKNNKDSTGAIRKNPWQKIYNLRDQIAENYGIAFTEVISTSAFLRSKFRQLNFSKYLDVDMNTNLTVYNFVFEIEEILKGNKFFKIGDTISVKMIPNIESPGPQFIISNSYLIPVKTYLDNKNNSFNMVFSYLSESYGVWEMG